MIISGSGFGTIQGRVVIRMSRELIECPLHRWQDHEITITLAPEPGERIGNRETEVTLWVKLAGGEIGPTTSIRAVPPDIRITALSASELHPGQQLRVEGASFLFTRGTVSIRRSGRGTLDRHLRVLSWSDTSILLELDERVTGVGGDTFTLTVRNVAGGTASAPIVFKPVLVADTSWDDGWYRIDNYHLGLGIGDVITGFVTNIFGLRLEKTAIEGRTLQNQWTFVEAHVTHSGGGAGHGAEVLRAPRAGSSSPEFRFAYWADGWAWVTAHAYAVIEGPRGTHP